MGNIIKFKNKPDVTFDYFGYSTNNGGDNYKFDPIGDSWSSMASPTTDVLAAAIVNVNNTLYRYNGSALTNKIEAYNILLDSWSSKSDVPGPDCHSPGAFGIGNYTYKFGGEPSNGDSSKYDTTSDTWSGLNNIGGDTGSFLQGVINGSGYLGLGFSVSDLSMKKYLEATDTFETKASASNTRYSQFASLDLGTNIHRVTGGFENAVGRKVSNLHDVYDTVGDSWSTKTLYPLSLRNSSGLVINGKGMVVAGNTDPTDISDVYEYDEAGDSWVAKSNITVAKGYYNSASGKYYHTPINWNYTINIVGGGNSTEYVVNANQEYSVNNDTWSQKGTMTTNTKRACGCNINNYGYLFGGTDESSTLNITEEYDKINDVWSNKTNVPTLIRYNAGDNLLNKGYSIGGFDTVARDFNYQYSPVGDSWVSKTVYPFSIYYAHGGTLNDKLHIVGGNDGTNYVKDNKQYDAGGDSWANKADVLFTYSSAKFTTLNNLGYLLCGGHDGSYKNNDEYNQNTDIWTKKTDTPTESQQASVGTGDGKVYVSGGNDGTYPTNTQEYTPSSDSWLTKTIIPNAYADSYGISFKNV